MEKNATTRATVVISGAALLSRMMGLFRDVLFAHLVGAGMVADIMLADLNAKYVIDSKEFVSKGKNTPFNGTEVYGKVCCTIVDGDVKYGA